MNEAAEKIGSHVLRAGFLISAALLVKFLVDFASAGWIILLPLALLIGAAVSVSAVNVFSERRARTEFKRGERLLLAAAVPLGFLASSLDCTGLALGGCTTYCTVVKTIGIPLLAVLSFAFYHTERKALLVALPVVALIALAPHCLCYNPANAWWIDRLGASPQCYVWGAMTTVIAASALFKAVHPWASIAVCYAIIGGASGFFVGHHYFHFPW